MTANKTSVLQGQTVPLNMFYPGVYRAFVYDIESNKMILDGLQYAADNDSFSVHGPGKSVAS